MSCCFVSAIRDEGGCFSAGHTFSVQASLNEVSFNSPAISSLVKSSMCVVSGGLLNARGLHEVVKNLMHEGFRSLGFQEEETLPKL